MMIWGCTTRPEIPPRPSSVPKSATWAGGADGGAWIDCKGVGENFRCVIYNDRSGEVWARGEYELQPRGADRSLTYGGFDGDTIHLVGNRRLVRIRERGIP
jgi:hypothetical protein